VDNLKIATQYANDIISGTIPSCQYVKQACERFLQDLKNPLYFYNQDEVDTIINFINSLDLTEQKKPRKFFLESWQTFIIANIYGIYNKEKNVKKYRSAYIELARKNGKSQLVTALALYHLIFDQDAQIVISANSREQAKNVDFKKVKQFAQQLDPKEKHLKQYFNKITCGLNELIVTASDAKRLDGLNASFVLIDELHEAKDNSVYSVLKSSQGGREEPLFLAITTAGFSVESFCYQLRTYCTEILDGSKVDAQQFALIYTLDAEDNYEDPANWLKSNPNLNVSVNAGFLESEVNKAVNNNSEKQAVLVKNFNIWLKSNVLQDWIEEKYIKAALQKIDLKNQVFQDFDVFCGVDLASVSDITAVSYMLILDGIFYFFNEYYLPNDSKNNNINLEIFKTASQNQELNITSGNVCDYDFILKRILEVNAKHPINKLSYDRWNSTQFAISATDAGLNLEPFSQTAGSLNKPIKEFERLIKSGRIVIQKNSITQWMLNNVQLGINHMGNYSISKASKSKKIDGVAAMLNALGMYLENPSSAMNIY